MQDDRVIEKVFPPKQFGYEDMLNHWALAYSEERPDALSQSQMNSSYSMPSYDFVKNQSMTNHPIIEEEDEDDDTKLLDSNKTIDAEIDSLIKHYTANTSNTIQDLKQKEILKAQQRAKHRIEITKKKQEVAKLKEHKEKVKEKKHRQKELDRKRKQEAKTMYCNKRKRLDSKSRGKSKEKTSINNVSDSNNSQPKMNEDLGSTDPDTAIESDNAIKQQIEDHSKGEDGQEAKFEIMPGVSQNSSEMAKSRYDVINEDDDQEAYKMDDDYEEDFDIESPNDVNIDVCRGVGEQISKPNEDLKENNFEENKALEDQGGTRISQDQANHPTESKVKELEKQLKSEIEKETKRINEANGNDIEKSSPHSDVPAQDSKSSPQYYNPNKQLDGSTVVIADVTPSKDNIKMAQESPMIDKSTKEKLKLLGQSLDSKQIHQAIGNIILKISLLKLVSKHKSKFCCT